MESRSEYFECNCHSPEHTFRFWLDEHDPGLYGYVFLGGVPWWQRILKAVKYVFGYRCRYGFFDEFILQENDVDRLMDLLQRYKKAAQHRQSDTYLDLFR